MDDGPGLPVLALRNGPWRAEVYDPRPNPLALGARYVHGGYVRALWFGERQLTGRASAAWDPYVGEGLPEVFEHPLGFAAAREGEEYLRIGAGRLRRLGRGGGSKGPPTTPVVWELVGMQEQNVVMTCHDFIVQDGTRYGYALTRLIRLHRDGLESVTRLRLHAPWSHPVGWFAHPFFAQVTGDGTGFALPGQPVTDGAVARDAQGLWRLPAAGGLANVTGLWGETGTVVCHLDARAGGGRMALELDRPLDHLVLYASERAASPEPQLVRGWKDGEEAGWTLRYRWLG